MGSLLPTGPGEARDVPARGARASARGLRGCARREHRAGAGADDAARGDAETHSEAERDGRQQPVLQPGVLSVSDAARHGARETEVRGKIE